MSKALPKVQAVSLLIFLYMFAGWTFFAWLVWVDWAFGPWMDRPLGSAEAFTSASAFGCFIIWCGRKILEWVEEALER